MQFTQKRLSNQNHHISASRDPRRVYKSSNWRIWCQLFINNCLRLLFYIWSRKIQINTYFVHIRQKWRYFLKPTIFGRSSPKSIGLSRKHIHISMQNFRAIRATSFELLRDKNWHPTDRQTDIFGKRLFFPITIDDSVYNIIIFIILFIFYYAEILIFIRVIIL